MYRTVFSRMQGAGLLHAQTLWDGERPVAAQIGFLEPKRSTYHGCQGGWDEDYRELAPGLLVKLGALRYAVGAGLRRFDLGRGAHEYKFDLGARSKPTRRFRLTRLGPAARLKRFVAGRRSRQGA